MNREMQNLHGQYLSYLTNVFVLDHGFLLQCGWFPFTISFNFLLYSAGLIYLYQYDFLGLISVKSIYFLQNHNMLQVSLSRLIK